MNILSPIAGIAAGLLLAYCRLSIAELPGRHGIPLLQVRWQPPAFSWLYVWDAALAGILFLLAFRLYDRLWRRLRGEAAPRRLAGLLPLFVPAPALIAFAEPVKSPGLAEWFAAAALLGAVLAVVPLLRRYLGKPGAGAAGFFVLCLCANLFLATVQARLRPSGDEPHYLLLAHSLVHDADLDLENNYQRADWTRFFAPTSWDGLDRHGFRRPGPHGGFEHYSNHFPGTPALIAPGYALAGKLGASWIIALIAAGVMGGVYSIALRLGASHAAAAGCALIGGWGAPAVLYAQLFFPELPAALFAVAGIRLLLAKGDRPMLQALGAGACAAALPWFGMRYMGLAAGLGLGLAVLQRRRLLPALAIAALPCLISVWGLREYYLTAYGTFRPGAEYALPGSFLSRVTPGVVANAALGLLLDRESGLLPVAPVFALIPAGLALLWRRDRTATVLVGLPLALEFGLVSLDTQPWDGTWSPPARFLICCVPFMALSLAPVLDRLRGPLPGWFKGVLVAGAAWTAGYLLFPETQWGPRTLPGEDRYNLLLEKLHLSFLDVLLPSFRPATILSAVAAAAWGVLIFRLNRKALENSGWKPGSPAPPPVSL